MTKRLISFLIALCLFIAIPLSARYKYNPFTRKLDYYETGKDIDLGDLADVTLTAIASGAILYYNGTAWVNLPKGANTEFLTLTAGIPAWAAVAGVTTFLGLTDTPSAYTGKAGQLVRVNAVPDGLEFFAGSAAGTVIVADGSGGWTKDENFNIVSGKVTAGGYEGTAIANLYIAGIDQDLLVASSPTFVDLTISTPSSIYGLSHNSFADWAANKHVVLPGTIANVLSDHTLLVHTTLGLFDASSDVDHDLTTNYAANQHVVLPGTIANVLSDHTLLVHTTLGLFGASSDVDHDLTTNYVAAQHRNPAKVFYVSATGGDYTTIQAALNAQNSGGETFLVGPGTYTDTISFTANDQVVKAFGHASNVIVTQADTNIVDGGIYTDCMVEGIEIRLTAPTTAINAIQVGTGTLNILECRGYLATAVALVQADQPALVGFTEAGTIRIARGNYQYYHTGICGGAAIKATFRANFNLAELHLHKIDVVTITNSGTALATSLFVTTGTAVTEIHNCIDITITDPNATLVVGLGYVGGGGAHNVQGNHVDVIATANASYGLYHNGTATVRSGYNAIHASDTGGTSYAFYVGGSATLNSHFDDLRSDDGNSIAGTFVQVSSPTDGELVISGELEVTNTLAYDYTTEHVLLFGYLAGEDLAAGGQYNTLIGEQAGTDITTADYNTVVGYQAAFIPTTINNMTLVGYQAGYQTTTVGLTAIGFETGRVSTGLGNTFVGYQAGETNTSGARNTFIGFDTGQGKVTADNNTGVGYQALYGTGPTGDDNTAVGVTALYQSTGQENTAVGSLAGYSNIAGTANTYVGYDAGYFNESGTGNVGIGKSALQGTTGENFSKNVGVGQNVGSDLTTGSNNTIVGYQAATALTSGSSNVLLGYLAGSQLTTEADKLYIENSNSATPLIYGDFSADNVTINADFNITMDAALDQIVIAQSAVAGTEDQPLIFIDDNRTGDTATELSESTIIIDAEGVYGFYVKDGKTCLDDVLYLSYLTSARIPFVGTNGEIKVSADLRWDDASSSLGIGDLPSNPLEVAGAGTVVGGTPGYTDVVAQFRNTLSKHTALSINPLSGYDAVIYLAEAYAAVWDIRNDSSGPDNLQIRYQVGAANDIYFQLSPSGDVEILEGDFSVTMDATTDQIVFTQSAVAGTENQALISIDDDRTGATVDEAIEATLYIDADGLYALYIVDGDFGVADWFKYDSTSYSQTYGYQAGNALQVGGTHNFLMGYQAGYDLTTGDKNIYMGYLAGFENVEGSNNVGIGNEALKGIATNSNTNNVGIGYYALRALETGTNNVAIGTQGGESLSTGGNNTLIGLTTGRTLTTQSYNSFMGSQAGANVTGSCNIGIGYRAQSYTSSTYNITLGYEAGSAVASTVTRNFFAGYRAGYLTTGANDNVIIGYEGARDLTIGDNNIAFGKEVMYENETGGDNVIIGYQAGKGVAGNSYNDNTIVGHQAGLALTTGSANVFLGHLAGSQETDGSNKLFIDNTNTATPLIYGEFDNDLVTINGLFGYGTAVELTIDAGGDVAGTRSYHSITVNGGIGSGADDLDTITAGTEGQVITIYPTTSGVNDTVTVKDGAGNIECAGDFAMDHVNDRMLLMYDGANWCEVSRSDND